MCMGSRMLRAAILNRSLTSTSKDVSHLPQVRASESLLSSISATLHARSVRRQPLLAIEGRLWLCLMMDARLNQFLTRFQPRVRRVHRPLSVTFKSAGSAGRAGWDFFRATTAMVQS